MHEQRTIRPAVAPARPAAMLNLAPDQVLILLRLIWCGAISIVLLGVRYPELAGPWIYQLLPLARAIVQIGAIIVLIELLAAALRLTRWRWAVMSAPHAYLRIRTPRPHTQAASMGVSPADGSEIWHAAQQIFEERQGGPAPWLAMTLSAAPDEPVQFGAVVGGGSAQQQRAWVVTLRQLIIGYQSAAAIDTPTDPLAAAVERAARIPGTVLMWAEFLLPHSPAYPLRTPADASPDLLGPLVAQLRPRVGVVHFAEAQIVTQPCYEPQINPLGWRVLAHRRLTRLRAHAGGIALSADTSALERKLAGPAAHCVVRIVLVAENRVAAHDMLGEISAMLGQYAARSGQVLQAFRMAASGTASLADRTRAKQYWLRRLVVRAPRCVPPAALMLPFPQWRAPAILGTAELGGIWHLPSPSLGELAAWLPARQLTAPPHAFIGASTMPTPTGQHSPRITLGYATRSDGLLAPVGPTLYDLRNIGHLTAGMGAGKSRFLANFCRQIIDEGFTLIDGKGDDAGNLTAAVRQYLGQDAERRVVLLDIADTDWPVGMNLLSGVNAAESGAIDRAAAQIQSIFARLDPQGWAAAPGMQQFLEMATRLVLETMPEPTIAHVRQVLIDGVYRNQLLERCHKPEVATFWRVIFPSSSEQQRSSMGALLRRFDKLLLSDIVRGLISQAQPTFRFAEALEQRLIVLCPIPHIAYGPLAATAAMLIFQSFLRAAFERPGTAATRRDYPLVVDEFQVLVEHGATQDVAAAVTQLRSLGIPALYAHQALAQIEDLRDLLLVNAENRVILRTQEPDASVYARQYPASNLSAADIASQEPSTHQYARFVVGGSVVGPISILPLNWPPELTWAPKPYRGPAWQRHLPAYSSPAPDSPDDWQVALAAYDRSVLRLIYETPYHAEHAALLAERLSPTEWTLLLSRWQAIARAQRQHILDNPGSIPDRNERVRWLSRLGYARPRLLAEAELRRIHATLPTRAMP